MAPGSHSSSRSVAVSSQQWPLCGLAELGGGLGDDEGGIASKRSGQRPGELETIDPVGSRDMDQPGSARLGQGHDRPSNVGSIARVRHLIGRADEGTALTQRLRELIGEVFSLALRPVDPGRPHGQKRRAESLGEYLFCLVFRLAIDRERVGGSSSA